MKKVISALCLMIAGAHPSFADVNLVCDTRRSAYSVQVPCGVFDTMGVTRCRWDKLNLRFEYQIVNEGGEAFLESPCHNGRTNAAGRWRGDEMLYYFACSPGGQSSIRHWAMVLNRGSGRFAILNEFADGRLRTVEGSCSTIAF
jgi:hypothetical protein